MVYGMTWYPCAVVLQTKVYIGGGGAGNDSDGCAVQVYDLESDEWSHLPRYQYTKFSMTIIDSRLTLVGGRDPLTGEATVVGLIDRLFYSLNATNQLAVFDTTSQDWTYPYPPMVTSCIYV